MKERNLINLVCEIECTDPDYTPESLAAEATLLMSNIRFALKDKPYILNMFSFNLN